MARHTTGSKLARMSAVALAACAAGNAEERVLFENGDLSLWTEQAFENIPVHTAFEAVEEEGVGKVIEAVAADSASGYIIEEEMPFSPGAVLSLKYKVLEATNSEDEKTKPGDDFALRVYITAKRLLQYETLVLVHSSQYPAGERWTSPYSGNLAEFEIFAISDSGREGEWIEDRVHVGRMWQSVFGHFPEEIQGIAFMVDSDNAHGRMHTRIARIAYSPR